MKNQRNIGITALWTTTTTIKAILLKKTIIFLVLCSYGTFLYLYLPFLNKQQKKTCFAKGFPVGPASRRGNRQDLGTDPVLL